MSSMPAKLLLLLAASNVRRSDFRALARWIEDNGPERFDELIDGLRRTASEDLYRHPIPHRPTRLSPTAGPSDTALKIERLLVDEAGLGKGVAAGLLKDALFEELGEAQPIPDTGRSSFVAWVDRVLQTVPESLLLHVATRVRNQSVHVAKPDWPLKKPEK